MKNMISILLAVLSLQGESFADPPAVHGMLIFGGSATYASHLPMFHSPHDYQVIMKIEFRPVGQSDALNRYQALRAQGESLFTLEPESLDLSLLVHGKRLTFEGSLFQGHFERGGKNLGRVGVEVKTLVAANQLSENQDPSGVEKHILFGEGGEYFAAHEILGRPSFDAIMAISRPHRFKTCRGCQDPGQVYLPDSSLPVKTSDRKVGTTPKLPKMGQSLGRLGGIQTEILKMIYLEEEDLRN